MTRCYDCNKHKKDVRNRQVSSCVIIPLCNECYSKRINSKNIMKHFCPECGKPMTKVKGTKGTYECKKCGIQFNPSKKHRLGDVYSD